LVPAFVKIWNSLAITRVAIGDPRLNLGQRHALHADLVPLIAREL
jgi:hypothetical protein